MTCQVFAKFDTSLEMLEPLSAELNVKALPVFKFYKVGELEAGWLPIGKPQQQGITVVQGRLLPQWYLGTISATSAFWGQLMMSNGWPPLHVWHSRPGQNWSRLWLFAGRFAANTNFSHK